MERHRMMRPIYEAGRSVLRRQGSRADLHRQKVEGRDPPGRGADASRHRLWGGGRRISRRGSVSQRQGWRILLCVTGGSRSCTCGNAKQPVHASRRMSEAGTGCKTKLEFERRKRRLYLEGAAATAGALHLRIVELEPGAFESLNEVHFGAVQIEQACL